MKRFLLILTAAIAAFGAGLKMGVATPVPDSSGNAMPVQVTNFPKVQTVKPGSPVGGHAAIPQDGGTTISLTVPAGMVLTDVVASSTNQCVIPLRIEDASGPYLTHTFAWEYGFHLKDGILSDGTLRVSASGCGGALMWSGYLR